MKARIEKDRSGRDVLTINGSRGLEHLPADSVFIRASDGKVYVSGSGNAGPLRDALTPEELAMVGQLAIVRQLKTKA